MESWAHFMATLGVKVRFWNGRRKRTEPTSEKPRKDARKVMCTKNLLASERAWRKKIFVKVISRATPGEKGGAFIGPAGGILLERIADGT